MKQTKEPGRVAPVTGPARLGSVRSTFNVDMSRFLTEGAQRARQRAAELAAASGAAAVEPLHLLWAVVLEESRAAGILDRYGLNSVTLHNRHALPTVEPSAEPPPPPESDALRSVFIEARNHAAQAGRHAEVGTEHLLWGLLLVQSPVAELLREHGLEPEALTGHVAEKSGFNTEPLVLDEPIRLRERTATDHTDTYRILDAAANRAREGLRVIEDFTRFTLDDRHLTELLKQCRHELTAALQFLPSSWLLAARDTEQDVGATLTTAAETLRQSLLDVVRAGFKRVQEALRTLEEYGKIIHPDLGGRFEQVRYRVYTLEKAVLRTQDCRERLAGKNLYLLVTESLCHHGSGPVIWDALAAGVGIIQVREKQMTDRQLVEHGKRVREWTREAGALFIMNDRPDLAVLTDADGVHVGQDELSVREARRIVGPERLIGVSTHTIEQARQALLDGADYLGVGPVFPSNTKSFDHFAGLEFVRHVAAEIGLPWFAIGGITAENVEQVIEAGATRIAVSGAVCGVERSGDVTTALLDALTAS